jgi:hypothetical protein
MNPGLCACKVGTPSLETDLQFIFALTIFGDGVSQELFPWAGLEPGSS